MLLNCFIAMIAPDRRDGLTNVRGTHVAATSSANIVLLADGRHHCCINWLLQELVTSRTEQKVQQKRRFIAVSFVR